MSRTKAADKPLATRVAAVLRAVKKLKRNGKGRDGDRDYDYTLATDVFAAVRDRLFDDGILLLPNEEPNPQYVAIPTNGGETWTECRLAVLYTFTDGASSLPPLRCHGIGRTRDEKALYIAQTGAEKAFLKRVGLMAEKVEDPEFRQDEPQPARETLDDAAPLRTLRKDTPLAPYQLDNILEAVAMTGKTEEQFAQAVATLGHASTLAEVKQRHFKELFKWASDGQGTIAAPKLQAVPTQGALQLRAAAAPIQLKIGSKTVEFEPNTKAFSV